MMFDSSVWIDYFRGTKSAETEQLDSQLLAYQVNVQLCPPVF